jgi:purine nucleosidase
MELIIDTDCGIDDLTSLILALNAKKSIINKIHAITTVCGNVNVPEATQAARIVVGLCGKQPYPQIYQGANSPLISGYYKDVPTFEGHGKDGLGDFSKTDEFKSVFSKFADRATVDTSIIAAVKIVELVRSKPPGFFTICAIGPLTNIALAVSIYPELLNKVCFHTS